MVFFQIKKNFGLRWVHALVTLALAMGIGCVAGIPKVANTPEQIIADADSYFERGKFFQSTELLKVFLQRYPGHGKSDYAQFKLAESLFGDEQYALAAVEFRILVTNYGYSEYVAAGYYKEACSLHRLAPKSQLDQTKNHEAMEKLVRFVRVFPNSELIPKVQEKLHKIRSVLAHKDLSNALYYIDRQQNDSALIYLNKIIGSYPDNEYWLVGVVEKAKIMIQRQERDAAISLLSQAVAFPHEHPAKIEAQSILASLRE